MCGHPCNLLTQMGVMARARADRQALRLLTTQHSIGICCAVEWQRVSLSLARPECTGTTGMQLAPLMLSAIESWYGKHLKAACAPFRTTLSNFTWHTYTPFSLDNLVL